MDRKGGRGKKKMSKGGWSRGDENEHQCLQCLI